MKDNIVGVNATAYILQAVCVEKISGIYKQAVCLEITWQDLKREAK